MNGESRGFAFVSFAHASCAASAMVRGFTVANKLLSC